MLKVYDLGKLSGAGFSEPNIAIVNGDQVILSDSDAVHTIHTLDDKVTDTHTAREILASQPIGEAKDLGKWIRVFGARIEGNYVLLLKSIKEIGLNPKDFPREPK